MNIEQIILRLVDLQPAIMPQLKFIDEIKLVQNAASLATIEFVGLRQSSEVQDLENRLEDAERSRDIERDRCDDMREAIAMFRMLIKEMAKAVPSGNRTEINQKFEAFIKSQLLESYVNPPPEKQEVQRDQA